LGYDFKLLKEVQKINEEQRKYFVGKVKEHLWVVKGKKIAVLGLSFKPDTDDMRFAPSLDIVHTLSKEGADLVLYDPKAHKEAKSVFSALGLKKLKFAKDVYTAVKGCDCVCFLTEWEEFQHLDFKKIYKLMHYPFIADGRNMFNSDNLRKLGFSYIGVGK
jgi:UDPglucose 6-dehydrogenase